MKNTFKENLVITGLLLYFKDQTENVHILTTGKVKGEHIVKDIFISKLHSDKLTFEFIYNGYNNFALCSVDSVITQIESQLNSSDDTVIIIKSDLLLKEELSVARSTGFLAFDSLNDATMHNTKDSKQDILIPGTYTKMDINNPFNASSRLYYDIILALIDETTKEKDKEIMKSCKTDRIDMTYEGCVKWFKEFNIDNTVYFIYNKNGIPETVLIKSENRDYVEFYTPYTNIFGEISKESFRQQINNFVNSKKDTLVLSNNNIEKSTSKYDTNIKDKATEVKRCLKPNKPILSHNLFNLIERHKDNGTLVVEGSYGRYHDAKIVCLFKQDSRYYIKITTGFADFDFSCNNIDPECLDLEGPNLVLNISSWD